MLAVICKRTAIQTAICLSIFAEFREKQKGRTGINIKMQPSESTLIVTIRLSAQHKKQLLINTLFPRKHLKSISFTHTSQSF